MNKPNGEETSESSSYLLFDLVHKMGWWQRLKVFKIKSVKVILLVSF